MEKTKFMNPVLVQKYGGTSVANIDRMTKVAQHIKSTAEKNQRKLVVVVSAMGDYTDELIQMAKALNPWPPRRELDMLLSAGERISSALLCMTLHKFGVPAISLTGSQSGILTDEVHGNARIIKILGDRIREAFKTYEVVIIAGFQGVSPITKDVTTLGRGGSDLTAIALAIALGAENCQIYTDVPGVMTADPRFVTNTKVLRSISWDAMTELANAGAGVLHHRGAFVAQKFKMPVEILASTHPEEKGTRIEGKPMETAQVIAITSKKDQARLRLHINSTQNAIQSVMQGLQWLWRNEEFPAIYRSFQEGTGITIEAVFNGSLLTSFLDFFESMILEEKGHIQILGKEDEVATLSIVGAGFRQAPELPTKIFAVLGEAPKLFEIKDTAILICVSQSQEKVLLQKLHEALFP